MKNSAGQVEAMVEMAQRKNVQVGLNRERVKKVDHKGCLCKLEKNPGRQQCCDGREIEADFSTFLSFPSLASIRERKFRQK